MKTLTLMAALAVVLAAAVVFAPGSSVSRADPVTAASAQGLVYAQHLIVLHGDMISVYSLEKLPDLTLENTLGLPTSTAGGARRMQAASAGPTPAAPTEAEVEAGMKVYDGNGCSDCHKIDGKGGTVGPDLSRVGADRTPAYIGKIIADPNSVAPGSMMPAYDLPKEKFDDLVDYLRSLK